MNKKTTTLSLRSDTIEIAKKNFINMSEVADKAIREAAGMKKVEVDENIKNCEYCDREMRKATSEDMHGLMWLCPDEKWICPSCLNQISLNQMKVSG